MSYYSSFDNGRPSSGSFERAPMGNFDRYAGSRHDRYGSGNLDYNAAHSYDERPSARYSSAGSYSARPLGKRAYSVGGHMDAHPPPHAPSRPPFPPQRWEFGAAQAVGGGPDPQRKDGPPRGSSCTSCLTCVSCIATHWRSILQVIAFLYVTVALVIFTFSGKNSAVAQRARQSRAWIPGQLRGHKLLLATVPPPLAVLPHQLPAAAGAPTTATLVATQTTQPLATQTPAVAAAAVTQPQALPAVQPQSDAAASGPSASGLPPGFDWRSYLRWNADIKSAGIEDQAGAEAHYLANGASELRLYAPANITLRYTACGGVFNQQYSHLAALLLAYLGGFTDIVWPPLLQRDVADPTGRTWSLADASLVWDLPAIADQMQKQFGVGVTKHADNCKLPNLAEPLTAFQDCPATRPFDLTLKYEKPVYIKHLSPLSLLADVLMAVHDAYAIKQLAAHPRTVLIDMPCMLFSLDLRGMPIVEDISTGVKWAPALQRLADQVVKGIRGAGGPAAQFNGIHLRMERDASEWAASSGGAEQYWGAYKEAMRKARFEADPRALYIASGLLARSKLDDLGRASLMRLSNEMLTSKFATQVLHKELYLREPETSALHIDQLAVVDFLVLRQAASVVGISTSTFSFYLQEARLIEGRDPQGMTLLMLPAVGTDELFYAAAVVAVKTRMQLKEQGRLNEVCQRANLEPCFS